MQGVQEVIVVLLALLLSAWRLTMIEALDDAAQPGALMNTPSNVKSWLGQKFAVPRNCVSDWHVVVIFMCRYKNEFRSVYTLTLQCC